MPKRKVQTSITDFSESSESGRTERKKLKVTKKSSDTNVQAKLPKTVKLTETATQEAKASEKRINKTLTDFSTIDFQCNKQASNGKTWNFKISSWNIVSLRALVKKVGMDYVQHESPDIMCFQETKCTEKTTPEKAKLKEYHRYFSEGKKSGYAGVALYSKKKPYSVKYGIDNDYDDEGRVITAEYEDFFLVTAYVPNADIINITLTLITPNCSFAARALELSGLVRCKTKYICNVPLKTGRDLITLPKRMDWDISFRLYLSELNNKKPVILCGDLNVAHHEIDLKNPASNTRSAGFTQEERDGFTALLNEGFVDTFRKLYPDKIGAYTFWSYIGNARSRNVGWRLDYFVVSERLMPAVCDSVIRSDVYGSDHCPITLFLNI